MISLPGVYGRSFVERTGTKEPVELILRKEKLPHGMRQLNGYIVIDGKERQVGFIKYCKVGPGLHTNNLFGSVNRLFTGADLYYGRYPNAEKSVPFICIERVDTEPYNDKYEKIGTKLVQCVVEISLKRKFGSAGRVRASAQRDSHVFYNKLGFLSQTGLQLFDADRDDPYLSPKEVDAEIEALKPLGHPRNRKRTDLGHVEMFLPKESIDTWKQKIYESRILCAHHQAKTNREQNSVNVE